MLASFNMLYNGRILIIYQARVDDKGLAALSYNAKINSNFTLGIGAAFDTQKLNESTHKVSIGHQLKVFKPFS